MGSPAGTLFEVSKPNRESAIRIDSCHEVLVADELTLLRDGLAAIIDSTHRYQVVAHSSDGATALRTIQHLRPAFAVLDFHLPGCFCLDVVRQIRQERIDTKVIVLAMRCDKRSVTQAFKAGVSAFLPKMAPSNELIRALDRALEGDTYIPSSLGPGDPGTESGGAEGDVMESLSPREYQVFSLMVDGVRAKEIASRLGLSPKTVDTYRSNLMRKLDIHDLAGLVKFAIERELTSLR